MGEITYELADNTELATEANLVTGAIVGKTKLRGAISYGCKNSISKNKILQVQITKTQNMVFCETIKGRRVVNEIKAKFWEAKKVVSVNKQSKEINRFEFNYFRYYGE